MNLHPALLAVILIDGLAAIALIAASVGAIRIMLGWNDGAPTQAQLSLERIQEESSAFARLGFALYALCGLCLLIVLNHVLPHLVPGAMCGVGALQAMPGGHLALFLRILALAILWVWFTLDRLDRSAPLAPLATTSARTLLVSAPIALVAAWQTNQALLYVDLQQPVSCCAAVYNLASVGSSPSQGPGVAGFPHALVASLGGLVLILASWLLRRRSRHVLPSRWTVLAWTLSALGWVGLAGWVLVDVAGPYLYGALGHRCPLCFFLPHHLGVGYVAYGALATVVAGTLTGAVAILTAMRCKDLELRARKLMRQSALWAAAATCVYLVLVFGPVLGWKLRFGVWIGG